MKSARGVLIGVFLALLAILVSGVRADSFDPNDPYPSGGTAGRQVAEGFYIRVLESRCVHEDTSTGSDGFVNTGDPIYLASNLVGIAESSASAATDMVLVAISGIYNVTVVPASSVAYGGLVYIHTSTGVLSETAADGAIFGIALTSATITSETVIPVLLGGVKAATRPVTITSTTSTVTVTAANTGMAYATADVSAVVTYNLPTAAAGLWYTFVDLDPTETFDLQIQAASGDTINGGTAAKIYECTGDAVKQSCTLLALDATQWIVVNEVGTWANNNS